jgi:5'-3' exonuclease
MGVRFLNNLIKKAAPNAMKYVQLSHYRGKTIVVDTSIYMHKYLGSNSLMESMYFMISQFKHLDITPIFVFDGAAPVEKQGVLTARENVRQSAMQRYNNLSRILEGTQQQQQQQQQEQSEQTKQLDDAVVDGGDTGIESGLEVDEIHRRMHSLKKRFMRISNYEIGEMKRLMREYDVHYIDCDGESDLVCAQLVKSGTAQACMSDDMDLFLYGCPVVLRHVNIWYGTGIEYTLSTVLNGLGISLRGFRMACVLSGTDYTFGTSGSSSNSNSNVTRLTRLEHDDSSESDSAATTCKRIANDCDDGTGCSVNGSINGRVSTGSTRKMFRIYLSDIVRYYLEYCTETGSVDNTSNDFDEGFYDWVTTTHIRGRIRKHVSEKELYHAKEMFRRAYAIFASDPSEHQTLAISRVFHDVATPNENNTAAQDSTVLLKTGSISNDVSSSCTIPYKVRRIMAKYNFIYI